MKSPSHQDIIEDIKSLKIQGAHAVALAGLECLKIASKEKEDLKEVADKLISARATEPMLRNAINVVLASKNIETKILEIEDAFLQAKKRIADYGSHKIKDGMQIVTFCHSSTVEAILIKAHQEGRKFTVYVCETRPRYQGRITAANLAKRGIDVKFIVDSHVTKPLSKADLVLVGADSISVEGNVVNKVGSTMLSLIANKYDVPLYVCSHSWKANLETEKGFDEVIERRDPKEIWEEEHAHIEIINDAFEVIDNEDITGIISELGITAPEQLIAKVRDTYPECI